MCYNRVMKIEECKKMVSAVMARCYDKGLTTTTGGNVSARCGDVMLITPSGLDKGSLKEEDIAVVDIKTGANLTPEKKLSIETEMHRLIYVKREDAMSVVHSHALYCCLFASSDEAINTKLIAESWYLLDEVEKVEYKRMGTVELAEAVSDAAKRGNNAFLLENHGALTIGKTPLNAFDRLECLEQAAKLTFLSKVVKTNDLNEEQRKAIALMR